MLNQMNVNCYPNLKEDAREKFHKSIHKLAYPDIYQREKKAITFDDLQNYLARGK